MPAVPPGRAIVYTRYGEEKAVVVSPHDFDRLVAIDEALAEIAAERPDVGELALEAHALEDEPGPAIEDAARIKALLGL